MARKEKKYHYIYIRIGDNISKSLKNGYISGALIRPNGELNSRMGGWV